MDVEGEYDETALGIAARLGNRESVKLLIEAGSDVNEQDIDHLTPIWWAAQRGSLEIVEELLAAHADITLSDIKYMSPIHIAKELGYDEVVTALCRASGQSETLHSSTAKVTKK